MKKVLDKVLSMPLMVLFLFLFFLSIGGATFVESWYGTTVAQKWVYKANWFSLIMFYLSISLIYNIVKFKMFQLKKLSSFMFHCSFLVIVIGAALTRYIGFEGVMHIREGEASNQIVSQETFFQVMAHDNEMQYTADVPVLIDTNSVAYVHPGIKGGNPFNWLANVFFDHNNYFEHEFDFNDKHFKISCVDIMKNPKDTLIMDPKGEAYLEVVTAGKQYQFLKSGETKAFDSGLKLSFNNEDYTDAIKIYESDTGLYIMSPFDIDWLEMSTMNEGQIVRDSLQEFWQKRLYIVGNEQFMFNRYFLGARVETVESNEDLKGLLGVTVKVECEGEEDKLVMLQGGKGLVAKPEYFEMAGLNFKLGFGSKIKEVPFQLALRDFQLERYPGTQNPSSFASEVTLIDEKEGVHDDRRIFMNNVLDYGGYRFFQSSYDPDERGTILSVNQDRPGTYCTYLGYFLLGLGFFINLFAPGSRFRMLLKKSRDLNKVKGVGVLLLLLSLSFIGHTQEEPAPAQDLPVVDEAHAEKFAHLLVQDFNGRFKPIHTVADEVLRKVSRQTDYEGQNPTQVFIGLHAMPFAWLQEPLIYVSGKPLQEKFHVENKRAALLDFFSPEFEYLLFDDADEARRKRPAERSQYDKDVLKTDERFNVLNGVFNGFYLKIFPKPNDSSNSWYSPYDTYDWAHDDSVLVSGMMKLYVGGVQEGIATGDWTNADKVVDLISAYQRKTTPEEILPSESKIKLEIWYNKAQIFKRLMTIYLSLGFLLLFFNFLDLFVAKWNLRWLWNTGFILVLLLAISHATGLGIRWYLSGHAPWSNGYEAVVFIAFVTIVAGLIFKKTPVALGAVCILAWLMLFVAHMNQMDPEITNLVPVLKSYWLMIHVAIITGSYGFLGLGAMLGLIILIMNLFLTRNNKKNVFKSTKQISYVSEMTMTIGLFMLTIGTFLGGVWANESWGRYWGWDAKETWALASVLIYAVVIHLRFIPKLKSQFVFNAASLWAYGSIIMTFFGVNYYLTGLHSYAQGDPLPIPNWVPITVWCLAALTIISGIRVKNAKKWTTSDKDSEEIS